MKNVLGITFVLLMGLTFSCKSSQSSSGSDRTVDTAGITQIANTLGLESAVKKKFISIVEKYDKKLFGVSNSPQEGGTPDQADHSKQFKKAMELTKGMNSELGSILNADQMVSFGEWRTKRSQELQAARNKAKKEAKAKAEAEGSM